MFVQSGRPTPTTAPSRQPLLALPEPPCVRGSCTSHTRGVGRSGRPSAFTPANPDPRQHPCRAETNTHHSTMRPRLRGWVYSFMPALVTTAAQGAAATLLPALGADRRLRVGRHTPAAGWSSAANHRPAQPALHCVVLLSHQSPLTWCGLPAAALLCGLSGREGGSRITRERFVRWWCSGTVQGLRDVREVFNS